ncbi:hypothetical protein [Rhodococcus sp. IEGM 1379]|uniref:hypothetical protein n=1 Tax=Rhodococcus sp. IEGM 1379 TaxID=3047086 RepID=UPI0024B800D3|nr:hypothetical protein [Rhodococcus sp. IEGM 1379]MDI9914356.1 hypothetical protein [Rhodococcus sp. IEGM 1379]
MAFVERTDWVDTPRPPAKPGETPVRSADIKRWERGIKKAHEEIDGRLSEAALDGTYAPAFATTGITYDGSGNVQTVTENGITTTYAYNPDGTVHTDTRAGVTRTYTYDGSGNLTGIAS